MLYPAKINPIKAFIFPCIYDTMKNVIREYTFLYDTSHEEVAMVVNKGFSFSNIIGLYVYKPPLSHPTFRLIDDLGEISALYPRSVKQLYSQNSFEEGSIAYEFASVDETDTNAIVGFCSKYGLAVFGRLDRNRRNDYMFSKSYRSLFSEEQPNYKPDAMPVSVFAREVITMRRFSCN